MALISRAMPMTLFRSGRFGVISRSYTTSLPLRPRYSANGWPTLRSRAGSAAHPPGLARPSSCGEHIMPCDSTPRILPTLMVNGASPGFAGRVAPGRTSGTLSPALKFCAPQTICRSPLPSLTRHTVSLSAFGCLSLVMTWATTTPSNSPPSFWTPSTSMPSMVRRSASSSADQSNSTYCLSQLSVTFMFRVRTASGTASRSRRTAGCR